MHLSSTTRNMSNPIPIPKLHVHVKMLDLTQGLCESYQYNKRNEQVS